MDAAAVFQLLEKGITLIPVLLEAGLEITQVIQNLKNLAAAGAAGTVTDEQLNTLEAELDALIADFNQPMDDPPPAA